ncbi:unnamed protein product [Lampetra planeri]
MSKREPRVDTTRLAAMEEKVPEEVEDDLELASTSTEKGTGGAAVLLGGCSCGCPRIAKFSTACEMSPSLARGVVIWAAVCAAVCAAWPQDDCSPPRSPRPRPASHGTRPARPRSSAADRSNDAAGQPAAEADGVAAAGERTGGGRGPNRHKIHGLFNMDTRVAPPRNGAVLSACERAQWACPGMESRTCTSPSDCQGCYGLFTCSRTRRLCVHKRVARKTAQRSSAPPALDSACSNVKALAIVRKQNTTGTIIIAITIITISITFFITITCAEMVGITLCRDYSAK